MSVVYFVLKPIITKSAIVMAGLISKIISNYKKLNYSYDVGNEYFPRNIQFLRAGYVVTRQHMQRQELSA